MRGRSSQNIWILVLLMLAGVVLGGFIAKLVGGVLTLQFGLTIRFTIAGIIGIILAFFIYRKL